MSTQWGMWISGIMRLAFLVYLITAAWQDFKYRSIRFYVFAGFGIAGGVLRFTFLCMECSIPGSWQPAVADTVMALGIGGGLLVLSVLTRQAVGVGDGWFFVVSALYLGFWKNVLLLAGGLLICFCYCSGLLVWGRLHRVSVRKRKIPFLPFLIPVCLGIVRL